MEELMSRAYAAWFRGARRQGHSADQPSESRSSIDEHDGKQYVVLRNAAGTLAVYRVRNDGVLKGLKRWPRELDHDLPEGWASGRAP